MTSIRTGVLAFALAAGTSVAAAQTTCDDAGTLVGPVNVSTVTDNWSAPASYYAGVSGTGTALTTSLRNAMSAGHVQRRYGDFRYSAIIHDADPNNPSNIIGVYNVASFRAAWDSGATWNREHVWPQSRQPGSASNSSRGNLGDPHSLRPCTPSVNGSRGNKPFGLADTTGSYRSLGSYYFPGDTDKALIARSLFYSSVRYSLQLVDGFPSGNQMGDLASLVAWHYQVIPSEFERRRNHTIYSSAYNPAYYTNNRNAFVDLPGAVWAVFKDNLNDSQLWVGDTADTDGGSAVELCQQVILGTDPQGVEIDLNRAGNDGVYYAVLADGFAITDQPLTNGFTGAFAINETAPRSIVVGIDPVLITDAGLYTGDVWIDNLDMTDGLGSGFGSLDADDLIVVTAEVLDPSQASFDDTALTELVEIDLGTVAPETAAFVDLPIYAFENTVDYTAATYLTVQTSAGDTFAFDLTLPVGPIEAGTSGVASIDFYASVEGDYTVTYELMASDAPSIVGAADRSVLTVVANATVGVLCPADLSGDGNVNNTDINLFVQAFTALDPLADITGDGNINNSDVNAFVQSFVAGCPE